MKKRHSHFSRIFVCGILIFAGGLLLHEISSKCSRDENDLWVVKSLAENHYKLSGFTSFVSVSNEKTEFDKSIGQQVNVDVPSELYEFRLIRDRRLLLFRTYGRTGHATSPVLVDIGSPEKAVLYGEIKSPRMLLSVNQQIKFPLTDLGNKSVAELKEFYLGFSRSLRTSDFSPENEIEKLKSHVFWRSVGSLMSIVSGVGIAFGTLAFLFGLVGTIRSALARRQEEAKILERENRQRLALEALERESAERKEIPRPITVLAQPVVVGKKRFSAIRTPEADRERLLNSVLRLTSDVVPLLPEVQSLLEEVESSNPDDWVEKLRIARNLQWRAFKNGDSQKMEHSHVH